MRRQCFLEPNPFTVYEFVKRFQFTIVFMSTISEEISEAHRAEGHPVGQASPGAHHQGPQPAMGVPAGAGQSEEAAPQSPPWDLGAEIPVLSCFTL